MASDTIHVAAGAQPLLRELGIDAQSVFDHPQIIPWRTLPDRENCTLDAKLADGRAIRWHVKRYAPARRKSAAALDEMRGHQLLVEESIPTRRWWRGERWKMDAAS